MQMANQEQRYCPKAGAQQVIGSSFAR